MNELKEINRLAFELLGMSNAVSDYAEKLAAAVMQVDLKQIKIDMERTKAQIFSIQAEVDEKLNGEGVRK